MRVSLLISAIVSAGLLCGPADALARDRKERRDDRQEQQQQREERRDERQDTLRPDGLRPGRHSGDGSAAAARRAQAANGGGRVLSVEPDGSGYRVKVLKDGEVRTHRVEGD